MCHRAVIHLWRHTVMFMVSMLCARWDRSSYRDILAKRGVTDEENRMNTNELAQTEPKRGDVWGRGSSACDWQLVLKSRLAGAGGRSLGQEHRYSYMNAWLLSASRCSGCRRPIASLSREALFIYLFVLFVCLWRHLLLSFMVSNQLFHAHLKIIHVRHARVRWLK